MRFLTEIRDHFQSLETQGGFVFELHTVCIDHRSDIVRQVEEITRHVGFQMIAIHAGVEAQEMELASAAATMALQTARLAAKTSKESAQGSADTFHSKCKRRDRRAVSKPGLIVASVNSFIGQATYDFAKHGFLHRFGCLFRRRAI